MSDLNIGDLMQQMADAIQDFKVETGQLPVGTGNACKMHVAH
jgi:hypothetical protein